MFRQIASVFFRSQLTVRPFSAAASESGSAVLQATSAGDTAPAADQQAGEPKKGRRLGNNEWKRTKQRLRQAKLDRIARLEGEKAARYEKHVKLVQQWRASKEYKESYLAWKSQQGSASQ